MKNINDYIGQIIEGDCLEVMKDFPDNSIDLCLCDPPYGIKKDGQKLSICKNPKHNRKYFENLGWDGEIPSGEYFKEMFRISKNQIIWGGNYFVEYLKPSICWLFWDKGQELNQSDGELAYTSFGSALRRKVINRVELLKDVTIHPTQKPVKLFTWCIHNYSKEGDLILDPFSGSGTTAIAAHRKKRRFICIEKEPKYVELSRRRLEEERLQIVMNI